MRVELLALFVLVGVGIFLMRLLPLLWALRRGSEGGGEPGELLALVGPSVVAALLVASVLPQTFGSVEELAGNAIALVLTLLVALRSGNLGFTVLAGVFAYALVSLVV